MRNYYYELSEDKKAIIIGTGWDSETNKLNQIGTIEKNGVAWIDLNFKLPNGQIVVKAKAGVDEALETITDFLSKEDLIALCNFLYLWG